MSCTVGDRGKINATYLCALEEYKNSMSVSNAKDAASLYFAKKISEVTGLSMHYYVAADWSAVKMIVDKIGGIDVDVYADDEDGIHDSCQNIDLKKGKIHPADLRRMYFTGGKARKDALYIASQAMNCSVQEAEKRLSERMTKQAVNQEMAKHQPKRRGRPR